MASPDWHRTARYVWAGGTAAGLPLVEWVALRRDFELAGQVQTAALNLFAATRYRLSVNGQIIGHGPGRFVPGHEEFDSYDLGPRLRPGANHLLVEVCAIHANNFQSMPGDHGRFIAWGRACSLRAAVDLGTPGPWRVKRLKAWDDRAPAFSFAIGPVEVLDVAARQAALEKETGWEPVVTLADTVALEGRSLPMPSGAMLRLGGLYARPLVQDERRIGLMSVHRSEPGASKAGEPPPCFRYATFLHSPVAQTVRLGLHWGPHFLNGVVLAGKDDPTRGNRQEAAADLKQGWNLLCGEPGQLGQTYPLLLGLPAHAGLTACSRPDLADPYELRFLVPGQIAAGRRWAEAAPRVAADLDLEDGAWQLVGRAAPPPCPARMMSWDRADESRTVDRPGLPWQAAPGAGWTVVLDAGGEYLGHLVIDLEAPAGTLLDVAYDERLRGDGGLALFACNPFIESADRFIWGGGRQVVETFHPRGGRYVQLTLRAPRATGAAVTLHAVGVRDARSVPACDGAFSCVSDLFNWVWQHGVETIQASLEDTFCDSPWRERGTYLGDGYVQSLVLLTLSADHSAVRRSLKLFAQGQREDGQLPGVVPAWLRKPHGDFTLIYVLWLRDYWARTGDVETVQACLGAVDRLLASATWVKWRHSILWDASEENRLFIDWGVVVEARRYDENGVLNALRYRALECAAELYDLTGRGGAARTCRQQAAAVAQAFRTRLWLNAAGRFAGGTHEGRPVEQPILHVNILALAFGLADARQEPELRRYVVERLEGNAALAAGGAAAHDFAELYYLKFALDALVRIERFDLAERLIESHMTPMHRRGAWTFWECLHRGVQERGSLCHSWSTAALEYLSRYVLGVREAEPGHPNRLVIDPRVGAIGAAQGRFPHPLGPVEVRWQRQVEGTLQVQTQLPPGVLAAPGNGRRG